MKLTHSFLSSLTGGRCPTWLNEGMAQMMEPRNSSAFAQPLSALFQQRESDIVCRAGTSVHSLF
jgi:hypothetical protein